jgi:hypothetical protein
MTEKGPAKVDQPIAVTIKIAGVFFWGRKEKCPGPFGFRTVK